MKVDVQLDSRELVNLTERFPKSAQKKLDKLVTDIGGLIINESSKAMRADRAGPNKARSRTGNLTRQIAFRSSRRLNGEVKAGANYSKFVHGPPYHQNRMRRKENPFFTTAIGNSKMFIDSETRKLVSSIIKGI